MRSIVEYLGYANLALLTAVAVVALREWRLGRGRAGLWAALAFVALAAVVDVGEVLPEESSSDLVAVARRFVIATLVLFPYLLYRFTTAFNPPSRRLERRLGVMTVVLIAWTFALPSLPEEGEPQPAWFTAYVAAFVVHWTVLTFVSGGRLWRGARGEPTVARRRMQLLVFAMLAVTAALVFSAFGPEDEPWADLVVALLVTLSAVAFLFGLAPPTFLRVLWRRPEQERLQAGVAGLMGATSQEEVAAQVLPPMAHIVGARALVLRGGDDRVVGTYGAVPKAEERPNATFTVDIPGGSLTVWASPYAPYFGHEERRLLETLGALTGLALDRTRLFAQEREARMALERADELKSHFVALAAHELRAPVATVHTTAETLTRRSADLSPALVTQLHSHLHAQSERLRLLVEQLLDLSRLEAEAVAIEPVPFVVRRRVEELVATLAGSRVQDVEVAIPEDLAATADLAAFDRVVSNLLQNALRYGKPPIAVHAAQSDRHFRLTVEDRGPGVSAEFVPDLFERFTRSPEARGRAGTGLGLAIARSYAHAHRGDLLYEPAEPRGARFQLVLPRSF
ncbi:MAG: sensor histidine kinase [Candidatus Limnocylindria bacterium]